MSDVEVYKTAAAVAFLTFALVYSTLKRARSPRDARDGLRLLSNLMVLGINLVVVGGTVALLAAGHMTKNYDYWFGAMALFGIGRLLLNDLTLTRRNPIAEFFSPTPLDDRLGYIRRDTARLLDGNGDHAADPYEAPFNLGRAFDVKFSSSTAPPEGAEAEAIKAQTGIDPSNAKVKTFSFSFQLGRKPKS